MHFAREGSIRSRSKLKQMADGSVTTSRTNSKHSNVNVDNSRNRQKSHVIQVLQEEIMKDTHDNNKENRPESQTLKQPAASRRTFSDASPIWVDNAKSDHKATKTPDSLRSRTGRKIYANQGRELKSEVIPTRKFPENENVEKVESPSDESKKEETQSEYSRTENVTLKANVSRKIDMKSINNSSNYKDEEGKDGLLSGSESIRVNVPLTVGNNENANLLTSATVSSVNVSPRQTLIKEKVENNDIVKSTATKNRQSDRSKSRNRSKTRDPNHETVNVGTSRRGSSKFGVTAETIESSTHSRHKSNAKNVNSKSRSAYKSRDAFAAEARSSGRQRNADSDSEMNANRRTETRYNDRRMSEGKRRSKEGRSKAEEVKIDEQDTQAQSRSRSRAIISDFGNLQFNPETLS